MRKMQENKLAGKSFLEIFTRYSPDMDKRDLLDRGYNISPRKSLNPLRIEVDITFNSHEDPELIYDIEDECRRIYNAQSFKILPHFPSELFGMRYFPEILCEAAICGAVTNGFFTGATYDDNGESITISIPFSSYGVDFVKVANTESILSNIIKSRYGVDRKVFIVSSGNDDLRHREWETKRLEIMERAEAQSRDEFIKARQEAVKQREEEARAADPQYDFDAKTGISSATGISAQISETTYKMGATTYDFSKPSAIYGEEFEIIEPTPLADVATIKTRSVFLGTVFEVTVKETRNGDKTNITIGISDGASATYVKKILPNEEIEWHKNVKPGLHVAVMGRIQRDKFDNEPFISPTGIMKISSVLRMDNAEKKRVELHLHSNMSQMDALITPKEIIDTATRWGHRAIAVTDHGNVQAYPEIMLAHEKSGNTDLKILYGIEAYYVNDTERCVFGSKYPSFDDEMIVFDLETTGLSNRTCKIIEIGAVKIKGGEVLAEFNMFVDPECEISEEITNLTSITNDDVKGAPKEKEALEAFMEFVGDRLLIAHNANFDVGFIRVAAERCEIPFTNSYLDTVGLSKYVNPELTKHKLNIIAEHYKLAEFHHHRASDDARTLAEIFFIMLDRLKSEGVTTFERMVDAMSEKADPLKLPVNHMIIFAKNKEGLKNLYRLVSFSYLDYYRRRPRMPKSVIEQYRDGLIIGSACEQGELYRAILDGRSDQDVEDIAEFYDYFEIQPLANNMFLLGKGRANSVEDLKEINRKIYRLGKKLGKPVCATCDAHFLNKEDEVYRRILLAGLKMPDADKEMPIYLRTTEEMLEEFSYLGKDEAYEVVVENTNKIADMCEHLRPIPKGKYEPLVPGANEELTESCWKRAHEWFGDEIPQIVSDRLERELGSIIKNGFAGLYMISVKLVAYSESLGYLVGSRGSVGSSIVATLSGISEVNPLPPHYRCPKCKYSEFITDGSVGSGFDLDDKRCPVCGEWLYQDGHDIPFETFLGFFGEKSPDIDLNFSGDVQGMVHKYTEELFGEGHVFRAGTIGTLADKTAYGYIMKYLEERKIKLPKATMSQMVTKLVGIKKTTGQHPGGIIVVPKEYEIYDFSPVQHPADDPKSDTITTQFSYLHDTILKLDELGHDIPTKYKMLEKYTNTSVLDVKMNDKSIYELFASTKPLGISPSDIGGCLLGTYGIPEMGTKFSQQLLLDALPKTFADLLQISGLSHGTDVWLGNAQDLIKNGICTISEVVGTRDGIMVYLRQKGLDNSTAFAIMEDVRKGRGVKPEYEKAMIEHDVPEWYISSCKKIKYMFPKAHAAAYDMSAVRLGWYKIYYPMEFYAAYLSVAPGGFDAEIVGRGYSGVDAAIKEIEGKGLEASAKESDMCQTLYLVREALARGVKFLGVDLHKSDARAFLPENGKIRMPFNSLPGLGEGAADKLVETRNKHTILSVEDLRLHSGVSKTVIEILRRNNVLANLSETNQISMF